MAKIVNDRARIASIYRYPVKGLSPERMEATRVEAGETLPFDRAYAVEAAGGTFDPAAPRHLPKTHFLMLMRDERLALLDTRFDETTETLEIWRNGARVVHGCLADPVGRQLIEQFFAGFLGSTLRGLPKVVRSPGHSFSDVAAKCVSIINLATVADIGRVAGMEIDPLRFRGNLYLDGLAPWEEFSWVGGRVAAGESCLSVFKRISRCAATNVNLSTARRDVNIPRLLADAFGRTDCGIYARVETAGQVAPGMEIGPLS